MANEKLEPIGVQAQFDIDDFKKNQAQYDALLNKASASTDKFYQKQQTAAQQAGQAAIQNARRAVEAANTQATAQEQATKKITTAAQTSADKQQNSVRAVVRQYTQAAATLGIIFGGMILGYKALSEEATRLGDTKAIAAFKAVDDSFTNLKDTLAAVLLEAAPFNAMVQGIADGFVALSQVITITAGALTWFGSLTLKTLDLIGKRIDEMKRGQIFTSGLDIGAELQRINDEANSAANRVILAGANAPARVTQTAALAEAEKEAQKQREKTTQNILDYHEKIRDLQIKSGEAILSAEKDFQDKSAEAWATYIEKANDIIAEGVTKRAELARTLADAIASAELDYQRGAETASYNHGQKLADIERDYQNTIRNIQQQYGEDSLDAIRNLDAIGLIRAREKRDKDLASARTNRDQANAAENTNYQRQLYELQRALEDKKREAEKAYQRGLDDQKRAESEALRDAKGEYNKQKSAAKTAFDEKLAAIQQAYRNEDAAASAHYAGQEAALTAHLQAMQAIMARYNIGSTPPTSGGGGPRGRAKGGLDIVSSPTQFVAGEAGTEMVYTVPLNRTVPVVTPQFVNHTGDFSHTIDAAVKSSVAGIDGRIVAAVTKVLREVLG